MAQNRRPFIRPLTLVVAFASFGAAAPRHAQAQDSTRAARCPSCAEWNAPQRPFRIFGNSYYVGTHGLAAILITSPAGHVLIDGGLPESAPLILANIHALGFRVTDVKLILNSHAHYDHAGGIAELQRASGARVAASHASASEMELGAATRDDPQFHLALPYPPVRDVSRIADGDTMRVGNLSLVAHFTPGHTRGGTSWSWRSCDGQCVDLVYADSQTPVSDDDFLFTHNSTYPDAIRDFQHSEAVLEALRCDLLLTPHPGASALWERLEHNTLVDAAACRRYAADARKQLDDRIVRESRAP